MDVDVLVVGSVNEDVAVSVERLPGPGETLHGHHDVLVHGSHDQHIDTHVPPSVSPC